MYTLTDAKEEIRQRVDLVELISEHVALTRSGNSFKGLCPFHKEKTPSFHVVPAKGIYHCFGCKAGGDAFKFIQLREGVSFPEAVRMLADRVGVQLETRRGASPTGPGRSDLAQVNVWAAGFFRQQLLDPKIGESTRAYLAHRGISEAMSERFNLGLATDANAALCQAARLAGHPESVLEAAGLIKTSQNGGYYDTFRHRLIFPIRDTTRRVIGFGGRALGDAPAKYLNTAQNSLFDKGRTLYGLDLARSAMAQADRGQKRALIVEGYTDCIACHQAGFTQTVATLGTAMTDAHIGLLHRHCSQVVLIFDADAAGNAAAQRALPAALKHGLSVRLGFLPAGQDPADFLASAGADAFDSMLNSATDALAFTWEHVQQRYRSDGSNAGRAQAVREFVDLVAGLTRAGAVDAIQQGLIANQIGKLLGIPGEQVHRLFAEAGRRKHSVPPQSTAASVAAVPPPPASAEQAALTAIVEVLLNEPALYPQVSEVFEPQRFVDLELKQIGSALREMAETLGEFVLLDVLDRFADPALAQRVTDLHFRGERRGNFDATLEGAALCLRQTAQARQAADLRRALNAAELGSTSEEELPTAPLEAIQRASQTHSHFAPRGKLSSGREVTV